MSGQPSDALKYAPGNTLCRVELDGEIVPDGVPVDKYVGRRRRILARFDATDLLRRFAADKALSVAHLWDMPAIVREYLTTLDDSKRSACVSAACTAAPNSARLASTAARLASPVDAAREASAAAAQAEAAVAAASAAAWASWASRGTLKALFDALDESRQDFNRRVEAAFEQLKGGAK
jgi:hypothetical protein